MAVIMAATNHPIGPREGLRLAGFRFVARFFTGAVLE